jgi:hypothetical protein
MEAINITQFAHWVSLLEPCAQHDKSYRDEADHIRQVLEWFDCPEEWREPVRLMYMGASYYSAEDWYGQYVKP